METWFRLFFCALLASFANPAAAGENLHWRCWYDQQIHLTCLIDTLPADKAVALPSLPSNLPPIVKSMRHDPGSLRNRFVHIPLHTQPEDMEFTALLAKATVCGSRRDCTVKFTDKLPPAEEIIALLNKHLPADNHNGATALALLEDASDDVE